MSRLPLLPFLLSTAVFFSGCALADDPSAWQAPSQLTADLPGQQGAARHHRYDIFIDRRTDFAELLWQRGANSAESSALPELGDKVKAALKAYNPSDAVNRAYGVIYDANPGPTTPAHPVRLIQVALRPRMANQFTTDITTPLTGVLSVGAQVQGQGSVYCLLHVRAQVRTAADNGSVASGSAETGESQRTTTSAQLTGTVTNRDLLQLVTGYNGSETYRYTADVNLPASRPAARDACLALSQETFNQLFANTLDGALLQAVAPSTPVPPR
jgi:hypothetical protein